MRLRASRLALIVGSAALAFGTVVVPAGSAIAAGPSTPAPDPYSPVTGHPYRHGVVPTTTQSRKIKTFERAQSASTAPDNSATLSYGGGIDGIGVTSGIPKVYLVFWGNQWGTRGTASNGDATFSIDPDNGAPYIQEMFKGLGTNGELWSGVLTQYCDGTNVSAGATSCAANAAHVGYPKGGALAGVWYDNTAAAPGAATAHQIGQEAVNAAAHFGNTTPTSNRYAQYFILSATGTDPDSYREQGFCAWHDYNGDATLDGGGAVTSNYGDIAFANMPYLMDLGGVCGQGLVNSPGTLDGYSIVAGHEYAETLTDQNPAGGWSNNDFRSSNFGSENADECAWIPPGQPGGLANVSLAAGSFPMQSTWSNSGSFCSMSHSIVTNDTVTPASGSPQSAAVNAPYGAPLVVSVTDPYGNPVQGVNVTFTAPGSGASITFASPCSGRTCVVSTGVGGTATSPTISANNNAGSFSVKAADPTTVTPVSFSLTNTPGTASQTTIVSGTPQSAPVGSAYASPLKVKVADGGGNGVSGAAVNFLAPASGASVTFGTCAGGNPQPYECVVSTDSQGNATSSVLTANPTMGPVVVVASSSGTASQSFSLANVVGPAASLVDPAGGGQETLAAAAFRNPLTVTVADRYGDPVPGASVTFAAPAFGPTATFAGCNGGNPSPNECVALTDATGTATSSAMTAGAAPGPFVVQAAVPGAPAVQFALTAAQSGYYLVASDGGIFNFGGAPFDGSTGSMHLNAPIVDMAEAPGGGYYLVASDGGIFTFGGAPFYGSTGSMHLNAPIVAMAVTASGGYYLVASDGGIFDFGPGAPFDGSMGGAHLNMPIVGMAVAPGAGYYLVASDGGIFNFGGAPFDGSTGSMHLNAPIVGMAVAPGGGYYLVASDGGIFNFGGARFQGSTGGIHLNKPIVGMSVDPATGGYWLDASDGGIFNFNAPFYGSEGGTLLNKPMVGMSPSALP